ncbi:hypothetical protein L6258_01100, partial [Candidatus Parcubacteria bacterium]|nr:hypothetical protein [Candidatus Parcubacteria bacterium]
TIPSRIFNDTDGSVWIREGAERFVLRGGRFPDVTPYYKGWKYPGDPFLTENLIFPRLNPGDRVVLKYLHDNPEDGRRVIASSSAGWKVPLPEGWVKHVVLIAQNFEDVEVEFGDSIGLISAEVVPYEICSEMGPWILVRRDGPFKDEERMDLYYLEYYERYDVYYSSHVCDTESVIAWRGYALCSEMTDWILVRAGEWETLPDGRKVRTLNYERYDFYFPENLCDTLEVQQYEDYELCSELGEPIRGEEGPWEYDEGTGKLRREVEMLVPDKYFPNHICNRYMVAEWEYWEEEPQPPCTRSDVSVILEGAPDGLPVRFYLVEGGPETIRYTARDGWGRAAVLEIYWVTPEKCWPIGIEVPTGYEIYRVERDGRPYGGYTKDPWAVKIEANHQYQVFCRRKR